MARRNAKQISAFHKFFQRVATIPQSILEHWKCYQTGYIWFLLTCLFALLIPMFAKLAIPELNYSFWKFLSGGDIALFSMVIVISLVIDHFVFDQSFRELLGFPPNVDSQKDLPPKLHGLTQRLLVFVFPMFSIISCLLIYLRCQLLLEQLDSLTLAMELAAFLSVATYTAFLKHHSFDKVEN